MFLRRRKIMMGFVMMLTLGLHEARADYTFYQGDAGGFVTNTATPAYLAAQGPPTEFINFETDKFGNPLPVGPNIAYEGDIFSNLVTFSSLASATFGGAGSSQITLGFIGTNGEIGPASGFDGILVIDFLSAGGPVEAVGFGTVILNSPGEVVRFYDQTNTLFATIDASGFSNFEFLGVVGSNGGLIGRVELEGAFFAIQDIQYAITANPVPEPASIVALSIGAAMLGALRIRSMRRSG